MPGEEAVQITPQESMVPDTVTLDFNGDSSLEILIQKMADRLEEQEREEQKAREEIARLQKQVAELQRRENEEVAKVEEIEKEVSELGEVLGQSAEYAENRQASALEIDVHTGIEIEDVAIEESIWDAALFLGLYTKVWETALGFVLFMSNMAMQMLLCIGIVRIGQQSNRVLNETSLEGLLLWRLTVGHHASNYDEQTSSSLTSRVCFDYLGRTSSSLHADSYNAFTRYLNTETYDFAFPGIKPEFGLVLCFLVLLLWAFVVTAELIDIHKYIYAVMSLPHQHTTKICIHEDGHYNFAHISYYRLVLVWIGVIIPRCFVALSLLYFGCLFLIETAEISDLILNAVALGFVFDLDELFYKLLPASYQHIVTNTEALPIADTIIPDRWFHSAAVKCSKIRGLRELVGFIAAVIFVSVLYASELEPAVSVMTEGRDILCGGKQNFIYVSNLATGVVYYSETRPGGELSNSFGLLMGTTRYSGANAEAWMPMHISAALQLVDYEWQGLPTIVDLADKTWAFDGIELSTKIELKELEEMNRETEQLAILKLQCVDWDEEDPQKVALFSRILLERDPDFPGATAKCRDAREWCGEEMVRRVCPITCQCSEIRTGQFNLNGCPQACADLRQTELDKFKQTVRPVQAVDCFDAPLAETGLSYTRGVPVDWWQIFYKECQEYLVSVGFIAVNNGVARWTVEAAQGVLRVSNNAYKLNVDVDVNFTAWAAYESFVDPSLPEEERIVRSPYTLDLCAGTDYKTVLRVFIGDFTAEIYDNPNLTLFETTGHCGENGAAVTFMLDAFADRLDTSAETQRVLIMVDSQEEGTFTMSFQCWRDVGEILNWSGTCEQGTDFAGRSCIQSLGFTSAQFTPEECSMRLYPTNIIAAQTLSLYVETNAQLSAYHNWSPNFFFTEEDVLSISGLSLSGSEVGAFEMGSFVELDWKPMQDSAATSDRNLHGWQFCLRDLDDRPWILTAGDCVTELVSNVVGANRSSDICISTNTFPEEYEGNEYCHFRTSPTWPPALVAVDTFSVEGTNTSRSFSGEKDELATTLQQGYWPMSITWTSDSTVERVGWRLCTPAA